MPISLACNVHTTTNPQNHALTLENHRFKYTANVGRSLIADGKTISPTIANTMLVAVNLFTNFVSIYLVFLVCRKIGFSQSQLGMSRQMLLSLRVSHK